MNSYLESLRREIEQTTGAVGAGALAHAPNGKWSAAQILEHLFLTYKNTTKGLAKCLEQGAPSASRPTVRDRVATALVTGIGYLPNGRVAPERVMPRGIAPEEVRREIATALEKLGESLDACERRFGSRTKILNHPFLGPLTANEWRKFHLVHGRHHVRQIRERLRSSEPG
jgi:hypothetical protein